MTSRRWPYPDLRNGATLNHITDTHFGVEAGTFSQYTWMTGWFERFREDLEHLKVAQQGGHVHTGDMINGWFSDDGGADGTALAKNAAQTSEYVAWRNFIKAEDGLPFAEAVGNHDLFGGYSGDGAGTEVPLDSAGWAVTMGLPAPNNAYSMGQVRVLTLAPDSWQGIGDGALPFNLSTATLDWLDTELSADSRPTFIAAHVPPLAQYPGDSLTLDGSNPRLREIIGSHDNVTGILSGHRHNGIDDAAAFQVVTIGGKQLFAICGEGGGGAWVNGGGAWSGGQYGHAGAFSSYITLLDDNTLDVRWRNHLTRSWARRTDGTSHLLLQRASAAPGTVTITDSGTGWIEVSGSGVTDNGDGTLTLNSTSLSVDGNAVEITT